MINLGNNLKKIRESSELSQEIIASKLGVSRQAISQWEHGLTYPDIKNLVRLTQIFCCDINELLF
ncbi:helix-turn-helix domain-containing protein [Lentilactobacillus buchneri]|uniref:helix-turn-helix domain-containing protein n=1 Tax=Lentilactobacillus buchneri TaxID=1581 RepID=UPI0005CA24D5|nr:MULTISPECIES: helix-turn-helix transcriptional regulator [Lentilactobacillus]MCT2901080.1 XRE family transcriptional regulator [Lentilactobacillus buchneri]MCT3542686.1 XRE family transcriptional regulator [Lentilactobacillus buchneri]MCT3545827.1 XRE family transcriptional regulator [Lentilactobacillus buchneri]MCT3552795.1 XRE family transcriptional regulator [Lentilactobacillus buchneri]MCV3742293.1 helix-turn-helix domain-containing protein [Lentilactobacillus hilgardii]